MANNVIYRVFLEKLGGMPYDEFIAAPGEIFYDPGSGELRLGDGVTMGGVNVTTSIDGSDDYARARATGARTKANGAAQNAFVTLNVAGQNNVVATSNNDTLVIVAGSGIQLTTNTSNSSLHISAANSVDQFARDHANGAYALANVRAGNAFSTIAIQDKGSLISATNADSVILSPGAGIDMSIDGNTISISSSINSFSTIAVSGQNNVVADANADTLTLVAGNGVSITTNSVTDTITFTAANTIDQTSRDWANEAFTTANTDEVVIAHSAVPIVAEVTTSTQALATVIIPGGSIGANGWVHCTAIWSANGSNNKPVSIRLNAAAGFAIASLTLSTQVGFRQGGLFYNRGNVSSQIAAPAGISAHYGATASVNQLTSSIDTSSDLSILFVVTKSVATDGVTLEQYRVVVNHRD